MNEANENLREEIKNKNVEDLEGMKHDLIKKIDDLDNEFEHSFNRYMGETEKKSQDYRDMLK
jgi:hypothetical protein